MRKFLLLLMPMLCCVFMANAQFGNADENAAISLVRASKAQLGLTAADLAQVKVSSSYFDNSTGLRMVYLQQTCKGIPVYNQMLVLAYKGESLVSKAGAFKAGLVKQVNIKSGLPSITAEAAVQTALSDRGLHASQPAFAINRKDNGSFVEFSNMGISKENISAQLMWTPVENSKAIRLSWHVYIVPKTTADYWMVRVDAENNSILGIDNYTDYDNWGTPDFNSAINYPQFLSGNQQSKIFGGLGITQGPDVVTTASYRVVPFPAEAPSFPNGAHTLVTDPWNAAPGNATSLKWNTGTGGTDYNYTRGNNVWAYQDRSNTNSGSVAASASSSTALPNLTFDFTPDYTVAPTQTTPVPNQQFNITNLFYWNNVIHDVLYGYGFDEVSGNFQDDNQGRGGAGNDHVNAEAQDGSGSNNANFSTPADGSSGRMQMYLWTGGTPQRDGDVDNGIIVHEFGHGVSNRLTGGPAAAGCLGNAEQMGEGWSDYYALMFTQDWANSTLNSGFNSPRGIGTYALFQPPTGTGIRSQKYCTDLAVNNKMYAANIPAAPHDRGEIWCATLWDMTWNIINQVGNINPNLYNVAGGGGNTIALKLVTEGLKLQQCSPGFISGRDAILQAGQVLYGGIYNCAIWEAFRRRGMGAFASEGSTSSVNDQIPDFTPPITFAASVSATTIPEGSNLTYVNDITTCSAVSGYTLRDTLPANVTYVSGGTYDNATRVVSFAVNQAAGTSNYPFTVQVNPGSYFPPIILLNEPIAVAGIPAGWVATSATGPSNWVSSTTQSHSAPNSLFGVDNGSAVTDFRVSTSASIALGATPMELTFWHNYDTESAWDGGVVEISTNGGTTWTDLGPFMTINGYNNTLDPNPAGTNPIKGRQAFTGNSGGWIKTTVNLSTFANQNAMFRFRMTSDDNTAEVGWYVDDILISARAQVKMRSSLFNASNNRVSYKDMVTEITQVVACAPTITQQPVDVVSCASSSVTFTCVGSATGGVTYQWQVSTAGIGGPFTNLANAAPYSGVTTSVLTVNPTAVALNGYYYRCVVTGACAPDAISDAAKLTVAAASVGGTINPANTQVCGVVNSGTLILSGRVGNVLRWESATAIAGPYTAIANNTDTLTFNNLTQTTFYRAVVQFAGCAEANSSIATVTFSAASPLLIVAIPGTTICEGDPTLLTVHEVGGPVPYALTQSTSTTIVTNNSVSCNAGGLHTDNSYWRAYNLAPLALPSALTVTNVSFGIEQATGGGQPVTVRLYTQTSGTFPGGTRTLIGTQNATVPDQSGTIFTVNFATPVVVPNTAVLIVELFTPSGQATGKSFFIGSNTAPQTGASYLSAAACGVTTPTDVAAIGFPNMHIILNVGGTVLGPGVVATGTFLWSPAAGLSSTTSNPVAASPMVTTTYTVSNDNGAGCIRQANITINVNKRPVVTGQPVSVAACVSTSTTFTVTGTGTALTYQWQLSTTGVGGPWANVTNAAPYSGATTATLTVNPVTVAMNGYAYRCVLGGTCPPGIPPLNVSGAALLTVNPLPVVTVTPTTGCGGVKGISSLKLTASGADTYTWAPTTGLYLDTLATVPYTGGNAATVYAVPTVFTVYTVTGTLTGTGCFNTATASINYTPPAPTVTPASVTMCLGDSAVRLTSSSSTTNKVSFSSGTISVAIPEGTFPNGPYNAGVSSIPVSGIPAGVTIARVDVKLNITHAYVGDVVAVLKAPNGQVFNLDALLSATNNPGTNFVNTVISSAGTAALSSGSGSYTGTFKADAAGATFTIAGFTLPGGPIGYIPTTQSWSSLYSTPNGNWTVALYDAGAPDVGTLTNWSIDITYIQGVPSTAATWSPLAGLFNDANATVAYTGTAQDTVYTKPTPSGVYNYYATVQSVPLSGTIPLPPQVTTFTGNVRGYWFTAPSSFTMSALYVPTNASSGNQNIAVIKFNGATPPPAFPGTTNAFTTLFLTQNNTSGAPIPVNIPINAGDVIGILGNRNNINSYGTGPATTIINGTPVTLTRMGMQLPLATNTPQNIWQEPGGSISRVAFDYILPVPQCTSPARKVVVTVNEPTTIATQPVKQTICTDKVATFTVEAAGSGPFSYQWQESSNNGNTWTNLSDGGVYSGTHSATLTITAPPVTMSGNLYRVNITGAAPCAPVNSFQVILTVNPLPVVVITANPYERLLPGLTTLISSTVTPNAVAAGGYVWTRNGATVGGSTATLPVDVDGLGDYQLTVTDVNGCTSSSNIVSILDSVSGKCYIYPNPTNGMFQVRYHSAANNVLPRTLTVYDAKGDRVLTQVYSIGRPYDRMDVDMRKYGKGLYWVEIGDRNGNRITMCRVVIQ